MAVSDNPLQHDQIQVTARDTGDRFQAPTTNTALQLAGALQGAQPGLESLTQGIDAVAKRNGQAKARADALSTGGMEIADAVREGKIQPTQNPFYMQAYAREGAAVRANTAFGQLQMDSASWAEKNDPTAFAQRWSQEVGKIRENFQGTDASIGFEPVASQFTQQALASNIATNTQRIQTERVNNLGALGTDAIQAYIKNNPGGVDPTQVTTALDPIRVQWLATGGKASDLDALMVKSITSAAYNTGRPELLDALQKIPTTDGKSTLGSLPGVADAASTDKYHIQRAVGDGVMARVQAQQGNWELRGQQAVQDLADAHGDALVQGQLAPDVITQELHDKGYSPMEIAAANHIIKGWTGDYESIGNARFGIYEDSPEGARTVLGLGGRAATQGYSAQLDSDVQAAVLSGVLKPKEGVAIIDKATATSRANAAQGRAVTTFSQGQQDRNTDNSGGVRKVSQVRDAAIGAAAVVTTTLTAKYGRPVPQQDRAAIQRSVIDASTAHLASHQGDWNGAVAAGRAAAAAALQARVAQRQRAAANRTASGEIKR